MTPSGIKPTTFWLVAQWLNQLCCILHKDLVLSIITGQVTGLPSQHKTVGRSYNTLSNCAFWLFQCMSLEKALHTFTWCHKQSKLVLQFLYVMGSWWSNTVWSRNLSSVFATFQASELFQVSEQSLKLSVSSCQQHAVYSFLDLSKPL